MLDRREKNATNPVNLKLISAFPLQPLWSITTGTYIILNMKKMIRKKKLEKKKKKFYRQRSRVIQSHLFRVPGPTTGPLYSDNERSLVIDWDKVVAIRSTVGSLFNEAIFCT